MAYITAHLSYIISIAQIVVSVFLIAAILLQQRGSSLGSAFGGGGATYTSRRGLEKKLYLATIVLGVIFVGIGIAQHLVM